MKPRECRKRMLKALLKRHEDKGTGMEWDEILREAGISPDNARNAWVARDQLIKEGHVRQPFTSFELTGPGIEYAYRLMRPWQRKAWDYIKAHHLELIIIILAIVTILVIVILA